MLDAAQHFLEGVFAASTVKLASSIDDVVWLAKFLSDPSYRTKNALIYGSVCLLQTCIALGIATGGEAAIERIAQRVHAEMSPDKILTLLAGSLLSLYSVKLGWEYYKEETVGGGWGSEYEGVEMTEHVGEDGSVDAESTGSFSSRSASDSSSERPDAEIRQSAIELGVTDEGAAGSGEEVGMEEGQSHISSLELREARTKLEYDHETNARTLAIVAFLGSLDDLTLFVPMLAGQAFGWVELMVGATLSVGFIVILCICLTQCRLISDCLQRIPLVAIVSVFAIVLIIKGVLMK